MQQIAVLGMLADESADEGTLRDHLETLRSHLIERTARERGSDPAAGQLRRDLGMGERDHTRRQPIIGDGDMAIGVELEAVERRIVADRVCGHRLTDIIRKDDADSNIGPEHHQRLSRISRELLRLERQTAVRLRNEGRINDETLRMLEHELDLREAGPGHG